MHRSALKIIENKQQYRVRNISDKYRCLYGFIKGEKEMTWPGILFSTIKGTREFGLPWNSGLNKVYLLVATWCYVSTQKT